MMSSRRINGKIVPVTPALFVKLYTNTPISFTCATYIKHEGLPEEGVLRLVSCANKLCVDGDGNRVYLHAWTDDTENPYQLWIKEPVLASDEYRLRHWKTGSYLAVNSKGDMRFDRLNHPDTVLTDVILRIG
jgi:hypothetical protein